MNRLHLAGLLTILTATQMLSANAGDFPAAVSLSKFNSEIGFRLDGLEPRDGAGFSVASAGDMNGDGISDIIVRTAGPSQRRKDLPSSIYVIFGRSGKLSSRILSAPNGHDGFQITGINTNDWRSLRVASAGDFNGDGVGDIVVGIPRGSQIDPAGAGKSYVIFGKKNWSSASVALRKLDGSDGFRIDGAAPGEGSGSSVGTAGDFNGDGIGDIAIGAGWSDPAGHVDAGSVYVLYGKRSNSAAVMALSNLGADTGVRINGRAADEKCGSVVASAGDVNGDGFDDLLIGSSSADPGAQNNAGSTYVVFGRKPSTGLIQLDDLNGANGFRLDGASSGDGSGASVAGAGDFNGDGSADFVIGAPWADVPGRDQGGSAYIIFGRSSGFKAVGSLGSLGPGEGLVLYGGAPEDWSGSDVAGAGDFNGDGYADVIVGARAADPAGMNQAGSSYVIFGRAQPPREQLDLSRLDGTSGFRIDGGSTGEESGASVGGLRDMNGDGLSDILIGARRARPNGRVEAGSSYVIYGRKVWKSGEAALPAVNTGASARSPAPGVEGGPGNDVMQGSEGDDSLAGNDGSNMLNGGPGADVMFGGKGNDSYVVDNAGDQVKEDARPGSGNDTVYTALPSYTLPPNVENLVYTGTSSFTGMGNKSANTLTGGPAADVLDGRPGADVMRGGAGDDTYFVDSPSDIVEEKLDGGTDQIISSVTVASLSQNVEMLTLGEGDINATGNALDNVIVGSSGANILSGGDGADILIGGGGNDIFYGETSVSAGDDIDTISYSNARKGVTFSLDNTRGPQVTGGAGTDRIFPISGIENLTGSSFSDTLTGSAAGNVIDAGDGNDVISGLAGPDVLISGAGRDVIDCGADKDADRVVYMLATDSQVGPESDQIRNFSTSTDLIDLSALDANTGVAGNQPFSNAATTPSPHAVWYTRSGPEMIVSGDTDGDAVADFAIRLRAVQSLTEKNFAL